MHYLKDKTVYLAGNIHHTVNEDFGVGWRKDITPKLTELGIIVINPCITGVGDAATDQHYFRQLMKERKYEQVKKEFYRVIRKDLKAVDKADFLIFYHNPTLSTIGSVHEVINAVTQKKPVLIMCENSLIEKVNPWLLTLIKPNWLFSEWVDLFNYLEVIDSGRTDTSHWW